MLLVFLFNFAPLGTAALLAAVIFSGEARVSERRIKDREIIACARGGRGRIRRLSIYAAVYRRTPA